MTAFDDDLLASLRLARVIRPPTAPSSPTPAHISRISFHATGEVFVCNAERNGELMLVDAVEGAVRKTVLAQPTGARLPVMTHHRDCILYCGDAVRGSSDIYHHSYHDNTILGKFVGHRPVRLDSLSMNPVNDTFLSSGRDGVKFWSLSGCEELGSMRIDTVNPVLSAFDPQGVVFAVATENRFIRLYDSASFDKGPFATFEIVDPYRQGIIWSGVRFSPNGKDILVSTLNGILYVVDSFDGFVRATLLGHQNHSQQHDFQADWSPDSRYVVSGSEDSKLYVWRVDTPGSFLCLEGHSSYPLAVAFNPKYASIASACSNIAMWLPDSPDK